ncbi:hypothetical protein EB118_05560 [bacterium]|nr:hypothetical protein [bacterium]
MAIKVGGCTVINDTKCLTNICSVGLVCGNEGTAGQYLKSQGPGQPTVWDSISNASFSTTATIVSYPYENRGILRTLTTANDGTTAFIEDLGYFKFSLGVIDTDDDETSFVIAEIGTWVLTAPTWETTRAYTEFERVGRNYTVLVDNSIGCFVTNPVCQNVNIPGAAPNDFYQIQAYCGCAYVGEIRANYNNATGCVMLIGSIPRVNSTSACGNFSSVCKWLVYVQKA